MPGTCGEELSSLQQSWEPGGGTWLGGLGRAVSPHEAQVLLGGGDESIPGKSKERTSVAQIRSSVNAVIHGHRVLVQENESQAPR